MSNNKDKTVSADIYKERQEKQVDDNFSVFQERLPKIIETHRGKFALMRDGVIQGYFSSRDDAREAGRVSYKDNIFSVHQVTDEKVDLGYYSCYAFF